MLLKKLYYFGHSHANSRVMHVERMLIYKFDYMSSKFWYPEDSYTQVGSYHIGIRTFRNKPKKEVPRTKES